MYNTLKGYVYKFIEQGGRNPKVLVKFVEYVHEEEKDFKDLPYCVKEFLDSQGYAKSTRRNLTVILNNFVKLVYRYEGMILPSTTIKVEQENKFSPKSNAQQTLEQLRKKQVNMGEVIEKNTVMDAEYKAFLEKYDRITGGSNG